MLSFNETLPLRGIFLPVQCLFLAELRSSAPAFQRLLWRKLTLELDESAAIVDPFETPTILV
jgi:hypothetical protein